MILSRFKLILIRFKFIRTHLKLIRISIKLIWISFKLIRISFISISFKFIRIRFKMIRIRFKLIRIFFKLIWISRPDFSAHGDKIQYNVTTALKSGPMYNGKPPYGFKGYVGDKAQRIVGYATLRYLNKKLKIVAYSTVH